MELLKMLSANEIVAQILGFVILLTLLRVFAWKKVLGFLDKRKENIALEFKRIEEVKADIERMKLDYNGKLDSIEQAAKHKLHEAINESKLILEEARKNGHVQAQGIIDNAKSSIKYELAKAKEELKNEIVDLTIRATENVIKEKLTDEGDKKLVREFLEGIDKL